MAACITAFVLRPRTSGTRIPGLPNTDMEDPGDFANPKEEILCIAADGIQKNADIK
jgi:hypothetical protein